MAASRPPFFKDPDFFRPQTLWLLVATLLNLTALLVPIFQVMLQGALAVSVYGGTYAFNMDGQLSAAAGDQLLAPGLLAGFFMAGVLLGLYALAQFRQRKSQVRLVGMLVVYQFMVLGFLAYISVTLPSDVARLAGEAGVSLEVAFGAAWPVLAALLAILARMGIKRDLKKLRSADRFW